MLDKAIEVLEKLEENGFTAYIVGGFVRDYLIKEKQQILIYVQTQPPKILFQYLMSNFYQKIIMVQSL